MRAAPAPLTASWAFLCIGAANVDRKYRLLGPARPRSSNPVLAMPSRPGGVARNVAENLARMGHSVALLARVGRDAAGRELLAQARAAGIDTRPCRRGPATMATSSCTVLLDADGDMLWALADMALYAEAADGSVPSSADPNPTHPAKSETVAALGHAHLRRSIAQARVVCADLNWPAPVLARIREACVAQGRPLAWVAASEPKMAQLPADLHGVELLLLNAGELAATAPGTDPADPAALGCAWQALAARGLARIVVTAGARGLWHGEAAQAPQLKAVPVPPMDPALLRDATGAGDALAAGCIDAFFARGLGLDEACRAGIARAQRTLQTTATVWDGSEA